MAKPSVASEKMTRQEIINKLKIGAKPANIIGMARFGIRPQAQVLGVVMPFLRQLAKQIKKSPADRHQLAAELWQSGIHEAKILASIIEEPASVSTGQMDAWIKDFDSWDVCDQVCLNLFYGLKPAFGKCFIWAKRQKEFERRAGFALMASLAVKDKKAADKEFIKFLPIIKKCSADERNYVRKAVNWALRQIGKRNLTLNKEAIKLAEEIYKIDNKTARWIAGDALRELQSAAVRQRLEIKIKKRKLAC